MSGFVFLDLLVTIVASFKLIRKLRRTEDMFEMSTEIQQVGVFALLAIGRQHRFSGRGMGADEVSQCATYRLVQTLTLREGKVTGPPITRSKRHALFAKHMTCFVMLLRR